MNIRSYISAQAVRFVVARPVVYMPDLIRGLQERYQFAAIPRRIEDLLPPDPTTTPVELSHGVINYQGRTIVIRALRIFAQAISTQVAASTDDSEWLLEDVMAWASEKFALKFTESSPRRAYTSELEIEFAAHLEDYYFPGITKIGKMLADALQAQGYTTDVPPFQVASWTLNADPSKLALASDFRIERRVPFPYDMNLYYSQAPLKTAAHIEILEQIERTVAESAG